MNPEDLITDNDIRELAKRAEAELDERLRRVCMAAVDPAAAKAHNIRREFAREQCERFIREERARGRAGG